MPLDVIGTGLGRTGTRTLKDALAILGFGPCYHMIDLIGDRSRLHHWEDAENGRPVDWEALFEGYRSVVDYPGCLYWKDLIARYPNAKVLHTARDPAEWYESAKSTIFQMSAKGPRPGATPEEAAHGAYIRKAIWGRQFGGRFEDREHALQCVRDHNIDVVANAPAERLLVYSVSEGWPSLCAFLEVPIPDVPFPHLNTREEFQARIQAREAGR